jgi:hypothetical protein
LGIEHLESWKVFYHTKAAIIAKLSQEREDDYQEQYQKAFDDLVESQFKPNITKIAEEALESSKQTFVGLLKDPNVALWQTYEALLYSSVVWAWCSYELLMKELWEFAVNTNGKFISKNLLKNLSDLDGLDYIHRGKYISLDYLARYDFDLSNKLGSALLYKFDFTSPNGIKEAYSRAFPRSVAIKNALDNRHIIELEAARNVIVHNAGIIDEDYCRKTNIDKSEISKRLKINSRKVVELCNSISESVLPMMVAISSIISQTKRQRKLPSSSG